MKLKLVVLSLLAAMFTASLFLIHSTSAQTTPRRIEITAKRFGYTPNDITVKKGESVVLVLKSADVPHGLRFKELGIETKVGKGQTAELPFTADKAGDFVGQCSVFCGSGHGGMKLTLHVTE